ncbi:probable membrane-associated kinase regulator 4 [Ziziphus jujuba]|uniref:Membrane-associated kinase regulator 4 n=2 Tax=Ziziphus jujuba TaxID=326968 RepID=A0A978UE01_ZIZJJ|nr:probable membrane-associated kinase regulator 4 [Ziziphus jujuba]KAH7512994.1 hypothetical protein FEM48_Zijuj12G0149400 [Ziziphus jujuba var. spinosa]
MATTQASCCNQTDDDYIDMEVSSSSSSSAFFCYSISSPPQTREFEFQMSTVSHDKELTTSPADILFYKGKLLPLHLPPRLQMVQNILRTSNTKPEEEEEGFEVAYRIPSFINGSTTPSSTNTSTPLESCSISPSESCRVSCELNPDDEYLSEWATEMSVFIGDHRPKKLSWSTKLKQIKQSSLGQKIKQSRAYLKSLFSKSGCNSDGSCAKTACYADESQSISRGKNSINNYSNMNKKNPFGRINNGRYQISTTLMKSIENEMAADNHHHQEGLHSQRRSFSGVIPRQYSGTKSSGSSSTTSTSSSGSSSSSSSFSFSSNGSCYDSQLLKRSSSASSEIESSIEGAIAHCKQSNQVVVGSRKIVNGGNQSGVCSILSASRIGGVCADQDRPGLCRI